MADTNEFKPRPCHHCGAAHGHFTDCLHKYERAIATAPDLGGLWALCNYFSRMKATPPADAALADDALCESIIEASDMRWNGDVYVGDGADLMNLVRAALRARAVPEGWSLAAHPDGGIVVQHRTLGGCFVTEKENQPREIPGQILFYLASDMLAASKAAEGNV